MYHRSRINQKGQSLIETIGAIFILSMALSTALGLAIYAFSRSSLSEKQIVAVNLAREGIDVVRMMRDTNWLESDARGINFALDDDCGDGPGQDDADEDPMDGKSCYPNWLAGPNGSGYSNFDFQILDGNTNDDPDRIMFDPETKEWSLNRKGNSEEYHLCLQTDGTYLHNNSCDSNLIPEFARKITLSIESSTAPYTPNNPLVRVRSIVVWSDKSCPSIADQDPATLNTPCKIITHEYLSNWKDYR